jgi:peptide/nickel transport system substrate-binding protein
MSDVINRSQLGRTGEYGQEFPVNNTGLPPTPLNSGWMDKKVASAYPVIDNVRVAKKRLKKAGFHWNSQGLLVDPRGQVVSARILADAGATDWIEDAQLIAQDLKAIGLSASVQISSVISSDLANGDYKLAMWFTPSGPGPYYNLNPLMSSSYSAPIGQPASANYERFNNTQANQLLNNYPKEFTAAEQHQTIDQLQAIFAENLPVIPLLDFPSWDQYNTSQLVGMPTAKNPYAAVFASPFDAQYILTQLHLK